MPPDDPAPPRSAMSDPNASTAPPGRIDLVREPDFTLGRLRVRPSRLEVAAEDRIESLERRVMQVLVALAQSSGATVSRDELIERCWEARIVGEPAIQRCISRLRRLADGPDGAYFEIENVPRLGYRLRAPEPPEPNAAPNGSSPDADVPASPRRRRWAALALLLAFLALATAGGAAWLVRRGEQSPLIAVLPFVDLSAARDHAYFAEGVSEEILGILADQPDLRVIGRTTAARFKDEDVRDLRRVLGVSHVLEGSVAGAGGNLRLNVRLLRSSDGVEVWSERYRRSAAGIFALQDEIGAAVASELQGALASGRRASAASADVRAYDLYLAGRARIRSRDKASMAAGGGAVRTRDQH